MKSKKMILSFFLALAILLGSVRIDTLAAESEIQPLAETESIYEEEFEIPLKKGGRFYGNVKLMVKVIYSRTDKWGEILDVNYEDLTDDAYTIICNREYTGAYGTVEFDVGGQKWNGYIQLYTSNGNVVFVMRDENGNKIIYN